MRIAPAAARSARPAVPGRARMLGGRRRLGGLGALDRCSWRSRGPRSAGARSAGLAVSAGGGGVRRRRSPFSVRSTLGKSAARIARRRRDERIARHRTGDVDALIVEARRADRLRFAARRFRSGGRKLKVATWMVPPAENTRFCQRSGDAAAGGPAAKRYPDIRSRSASARRRKDRGRRARTARPSAGYATQTLIRSRNAYTIERQYIRAIRSFCWYRI